MDEYLPDLTTQRARKGIEKVLELLNCRETGTEINGRKLAECNDVNFILSLPTGYGKTTLSLILAKYLSTHTTSNFSRIIHVVPTRALVKSITDDAKKYGLDFRVQYSFSPSELKSPFFLSNFVITTYDSFFLNLYKGNIGEPFTDHGHYDLPRFSILTSIVNFDEYHLMTDKGYSSLIASAEQLAKMGVNVIFSSATPSIPLEEAISREFAENNRRIISIAIVNNYGEAIKGKDCKEEGEKGHYTCKPKGSSSEYELIEIVDDFKVPNIDYEIINNEDEIYSKAEEIAKKEVDKKPKLLIVLNTVDKAIEVYSKLKNKMEGLCLVHSRFRVEDKDKDFSNCEVIVSTQVIEVGVNISALSMITELAPLPSIVQRVGRVLRKNEESEGKIYIWNSGNPGPYDKELVNSTLEILNKEKLCLRHPFGCYQKPGYANKINISYKLDSTMITKLKQLSENIFLAKKDLQNMMKDYLSLTGNLFLNVAFTKPYDEKELIPVSVNYLYNNREKLLYFDNNNKCVTVYLETYDSGIIEKCSSTVYRWFGKDVDSFLENLAEQYKDVIWEDNKKMVFIAFKVNPKYYDKELGLHIS
ncbi:CRISPR-associated helicase Cas3' [Acidianus manzaensis]|nr:CRISPR-associated helicase Cas3' [Acidianus manzaensis]